WRRLRGGRRRRRSSGRLLGGSGCCGRGGRLLRHVLLLILRQFFLLALQLRLLGLQCLAVRLRLGGQGARLRLSGLAIARRLLLRRLLLGQFLGGCLLLGLLGRRIGDPLLLGVGRFLQDADLLVVEITRGCQVIGDLEPADRIPRRPSETAVCRPTV